MALNPVINIVILAALLFTARLSQNLVVKTIAWGLFGLYIAFVAKSLFEVVLSFGR
jgi:hypothetical protein